MNNIEKDKIKIQEEVAYEDTYIKLHCKYKYAHSMLLSGHLFEFILSWLFT